jgi:NhaP-type Na+/H+ or K+/H+ antiporter
MHHFAGTIALIGIVIVVASLLSGLIERSRLPVVAVFLALGAIVGPMGLGLIDIALNSPALFALATLGLALVLFTDALTIQPRELRAHPRLLWRLLGPGTLVPGVVIALAAWLLLGVSAPAAAILGAALASTDPVLLRTIIRSEALPATPRVALRIETGMNDVVLLPIVVIAMLLMRAGEGGVGSPVIARALVNMLVLGPAAGAFVGWAGISLLVWLRSTIGVRRDYESLYALGLCFTAYAGAEFLGGSGFLAAFAAGLMISIKDVELCDCFREYGEATAEMLLLLTFVALGAGVIWSGLDAIDGRTSSSTRCWRARA